MHKIFIAQKSHCACHVLSLATIRSKYYFNFTLSRSRSGRELFDRPFKVCVQNVHHVLERKLEAVDATAWPLPDDQLAEMFPVFDQALLQLVNVMLLQLPLNLVVDWVKLRSGLLAGHRAGVMKSIVSWVNRCTISRAVWAGALSCLSAWPQYITLYWKLKYFILNIWILITRVINSIFLWNLAFLSQIYS